MNHSLIDIAKMGKERQASQGGSVPPKFVLEPADFVRIEREWQTSKLSMSMTQFFIEQAKKLQKEDGTPPNSQTVKNAFRSQGGML